MFRVPVAHVVLVAAVLSAAASNGTATDATEVALQHACTTSITKHLPFCNVSLNFTERIKDLLGRLTTEEKLSQTSSTQAAVPRLGIPAYAWGNECLHGAVVRSGDGTPPPAAGATVFPQPIGLAATFDVELVASIGDAVATESRALSNYGTLQGSTSPGYLNCWAPNVNIFRDPRWGRGSETYGEDPGLTSNMLSAYVRGMQYGAPAPAPALPSTEMPPSPPAPKYLKVAAVCKHFAAYSLEEADGQMRFWFDAIITKQDLADTYLPAFKACVNAE
eukprot:gene16607-13638_t